MPGVFSSTGAYPPICVPSWFEPLNAELRAWTRRELPYWVELDASMSSGGIGGIAVYRFWAVNDHDRLVAGPRVVDGPRHAFALPPGHHRVFVAVADRAGARDVASTGVTVRGDIRVMGSGALASTWEALDTVTLPGSSAMADLSTIMDTNSLITSNTAMWIQAFGATGGYGQNADTGGTSKGGSAGAGGFAQCVTSIADYKATYGVSTIYYYLGDNGHHDSIGGGGDGGAATLVLPIGWTLLRADVVAIAGGGGGGGSFGGGAGHDGGAGAIANNASSASALAVAGTAGNGDHCGQGGDGEVGGANGENGQPGTGGVGGYGGMGSDATRKFTNGSPSGVWNGGTGLGGASDTHGGGGGGGYGGGGGGGSHNDDDCGGGGSGGSYAAGSTRSDSSAESTSTSSGSASGVVRIVFNLDNSNPSQL